MAAGPPRATCVTLWIGAALGPVERACLRSVRRQGHELALYCYDPPEGVPEGVELRDAREILPQESIVRHRATGSVALFSNLFRYELQRRGLGTWVDCDVYLLKPLDSERPSLFGEEEPGLVNTAILRLPPSSPVLPPLIALFEERSVPAWLPLRARLAARMRLWRGGRSGLADMPWGSAGPRALTAMLKEHGLSREALPAPILYPLPWQQAERIAAEPLDRLAGPEAGAIHLWNERIRHLKNRPAAAGSFLDRLHREGALPAPAAAAGPPSLSVVMPVYNALPWLDEAVESILRQSLRDFEFVILDDGSTDGSRERLRAWARLDPRIRLIESDARLGPVDSSNRVVAESRAPIVARMDADDVAMPQRLERQVAALAAHPRAALVGALYEVVDARGRRLRGPDHPRLLRCSRFAPLCHSSILFRREAFDAVGGYDGGAHLWEDVDLFLKMARHGPILVVPETLLHVRRAFGSTRLGGGEARLDRAMDAMYRHLDGQAPAGAGDKAKLRPASFLASAAVPLWAGRRPRVLGRLLGRGALRMDRETATALVWAAWADLSPRSLRLVLRGVLALRSPLARRRLGRAALFEWRPDEPPRPA